MVDGALDHERLLEAALVVGWWELAGGKVVIDQAGAVLLALPALDHQGHGAALQAEAAELGPELRAVLTGRRLRRHAPPAAA